MTRQRRLAIIDTALVLALAAELVVAVWFWTK